MKLVFLGKPGSGKGTQAKLLATKINIQQVSTGDLLREETKKESALSTEIKNYMNKGVLVPDKIIIEVFKKGLPKDNFLLDGFPRTLEQAQALETITDIDLVITIGCSNETIIKRILGREMCQTCGKIYGIDFPPKVANTCDKCQTSLYKRADDNEETLKQRLDTYTKLTMPLIDFYKQKGIYMEVSGDRPAAQVQQELMEKIESIK
jgi:adenylate kinase